MMDHPIMFSAPMVLRLLAEAAEQGTGKSMTRRLAWGKWLTVQQAAKQKNPVRVPGDDERAPAFAQAASPWQRVEVGDRLWVRENFWRFGRWASKKIGGGKVRKTFKPFPHPTVIGSIQFAADGEKPTPVGRFGQSDPAWHLRPNIFLPREDSRLTLTVTAKKIEPLQTITEQDCEREGLKWDRTGGGVGNAYWFVDVGGFRHAHPVASECFNRFWSSLHGNDSWNQNPEVVALTFRVELRNIDARPRPPADFGTVPVTDWSAALEFGRDRWTTFADRFRRLSASGD